MTTRQVLVVATPVWLLIWAFALSLAWLLPNHYLPWSAFHMDAWAAVVLAAMAAAVLWRTRGQDRLSVFAIVMLSVTVVPWLQYTFGLIQLPGTAWISFAYLLGFALAILVGQRWDLHSPGQLGDGLFFAIGIAALLSVGLQFHQWLQLDLLDMWSMGNGFGRPFANFGQPNQLGTLLLWGILALTWGVLRTYIRPAVMVCATIFLLLGLALTGSRTAWIGVVLLLMASWYWRALWPWRSTPWVASALAGCFFIFVWAIPHLTVRLLLSSDEGDLEKISRLSSELRPQVWAIFLDSLRYRPWFGYGWNQVATAHLEVAASHAPIPTLFAHSHNLFLDLLLWCGIPLGVMLCAFLLAWLWRRFRAINDPGSAVMFLLVIVVGNHAMLELPLHHAYFLLPTGLVIGALDARLKARFLALGQRWLGAITWVVSASLLAIIIRDYSRVEASYQVLRFEWANIRVNVPREPPNVLVLGQLRDLIVFSRFEPSDRMPPQQLGWMLHVASIFPSAGVVHKLAVALVWNNRPLEAVVWLRRMCAISPQAQCDAIKDAWKRRSRTDPRIAAAPWP